MPLPSNLIVIAPRRGDDVLHLLRTALAENAVGNAWIVGRGTFEEIELRDGEITRTFATTSRIVALDGRARAGNGEGEIALAATVARSTARGPEFLVGDVVRALAGTMELLVTPLELQAGAHDESPRRHPDEIDEAPAPRAPRAEGPPSPWAALADASAEAQSRPAPSPTRAATPNVRSAAAIAPARAATYDPRSPGTGPTPLPPPAAPVPPRRKSIDEEIYPEPGDLLDHFAFGRCIVLRSDGDEMLVQNPTSGRTRTIRISALHASQPTDEDGKRLFRLTQRRGTS